MYLDDIKLFAKNEKELETLIHAVRIYCQDIGMEFGIEKCAMIVMKSGKRHMTDGMELLNHDKIKTLGENETYKYLGILEADTIKWKWKTRSIQRLEDYIEKHERGLITAIKNDTDNTIDERMTTTRKQKWEGKQLYGRFKRLINNISHQKTWSWPRKGHLKRETESLLIAAQDNAIRSNHIKARIDKTQQNSKCRLCSDRDETIHPIISECSKLVLKEYKARHDWVGKVIHWELLWQENKNRKEKKSMDALND